MVSELVQSRVDMISSLCDKASEWIRRGNLAMAAATFNLARYTDESHIDSISGQRAIDTALRDGYRSVRISLRSMGIPFKLFKEARRSSSQS